MAEIRPFRALRFQTKNAGDISLLTCPPYDIISEEQRQAFLKTNPHNIIRLELPKGENPYEEAGETLRDWIDQGILKRDTDPALYIYEEEFEVNGEKKRVKGFICRVKVEEFEKGVVLPHEETLSKAKADRFNLMKATFCNFSQIYSLYMDEEHQTLSRIDALSSGTPLQEFNDGAVTHRLWVVNDKAAIEAICNDFSDRKLYIADGHHRYETSINFRNWCREEGLSVPGDDPDYVMMMLVDMEHDGLVVFPTHRLVRDLPDFDPSALIEGSRQYFDVSVQEDISQIEPQLDKLYQEGKKAFAFYAGGDQWNLMVLKDLSVMEEILPEKSKAYQGLDVTVLHSLVLERLLKIDAENMGLISRRFP